MTTRRSTLAITSSQARPPSEVHEQGTVPFSLSDCGVVVAHMTRWTQTETELDKGEVVLSVNGERCRGADDARRMLRDTRMRLVLLCLARPCFCSAASRLSAPPGTATSTTMSTKDQFNGKGTDGRPIKVIDHVYIGDRNAAKAKGRQVAPP